MVQTGPSLYPETWASEVPARTPTPVASFPSLSICPLPWVHILVWFLSPALGCLAIKQQLSTLLQICLTLPPDSGPSLWGG